MVSLHSSTRNSSPSTDESKVFYFKMKGGFYRFIAEFATGDAKGKAAQSGCVAYVEASKITEKDLVVNHPVRLAMALNFSVSNLSDGLSPMPTAAAAGGGPPCSRPSISEDHISLAPWWLFVWHDTGGLVAPFPPVHHMTS